MGSSASELLLTTTWTGMSEDLEMRRRRALWRAAHRGTKELDVLIGGYANVHVPNMADDQLAQFELLLEVPEPALQHWLLAPKAPRDVAKDVAYFVGAIRAFHGLPTDVEEAGLSGR